MVIEIDPGVIDSEVLMKRIKNSALQKKIPEKFYGLATEEIIERTSEGEMIISLHEKLNQLKDVYAIVETPIVSRRPVVGKLIVILKKIYRRLTRWIFASYYQQQTLVNEMILQTMTEMLELQEMLVTIYEKQNVEGKNAD